MDKRKLGKTDIQISEIAFGAWAIGGWMWGGAEEKLAFADEHNATLPQVVLNWTIQQPGITCALAGARDPKQVIENIGASKFRLSDDEIKKINKYLSEITIDTKI